MFSKYSGESHSPRKASMRSSVAFPVGKAVEWDDWSACKPDAVVADVRESVFDGSCCGSVGAEAWETTVSVVLRSPDCERPALIPMPV